MARDDVAGGLNAVVSAGLRGDVAVIAIDVCGPISAELPVCAAEVPLAVVDFSVVLVTTNTGVPVPEVTVSAFIKGDGFFLLVLDCCAPLTDTRVPALVPGTGK